MITFYIIEVKLDTSGVWYRLQCEWPHDRAQEVMAELCSRYPNNTYRMRPENEEGETHNPPSFRSMFAAFVSMFLSSHQRTK